MSDEKNDKGIFAVLMKQFEEQQLPRALEIKKRVEDGERLSDIDLEFLKTAMQGSDEATRLAEKYPEYQKLYAQAVALFSDITQKALENEGKARGNKL